MQEYTEEPMLPRNGHIVLSQAGFPIGRLNLDRSYWAVHLTDGTWLCEMDEVDAKIGKWVTREVMAGVRIPVDRVTQKRPLDWTLDLVSTGDWKKIEELWLFCPPSLTSPMGNTARLPITRAGTAFQFKVSLVDSSLALSQQRTLAHVIGRVTNVETGDCECFVFDYQLQALVAGWKSNIFSMGVWRPAIPGQPSIAPIGTLNLDVLGIRLSSGIKA